MATIEKDRILEFRGEDLYDADGDKIGAIEEIYLDADTNEPEWALVNTGLFGTKRSFVPLHDASETDGSLRVPHAKDTVKDAPKVDANGQITQREEGELYAHYGLEYSELHSDSGLPEGGSGASGATSGRDTASDTDRDVDTDTDRDRDRGDRTERRDVSGDATDDAMTRSEEELKVGTERRETGRARLRKYVVTEEVQQTVPVQREEVRLEREPITDANVDAATSGSDISEDEHEVVLHAEEPGGREAGRAEGARAARDRRGDRRAHRLG